MRCLIKSLFFSAPMLILSARVEELESNAPVNILDEPGLLMEAKLHWVRVMLWFIS